MFKNDDASMVKIIKRRMHSEEEVNFEIMQPISVRGRISEWTFQPVY
jgi:hypothetical protein